MPSYDYFCPTNARTVEVRHGMNDTLSTWGELAAAARIEAGDTPADAEVRRVISGGSLLLSGAPAEARSAPAAACGAHCACHGH